MVKSNTIPRVLLAHVVWKQVGLLQALRDDVAERVARARTPAEKASGCVDLTHAQEQLELVYQLAADLDAGLEVGP